MSFHQERLAVLAATEARLLAELFELNRLRDRLRKAQLSVGNHEGPDVEIEFGRPQVDQSVFTLFLMRSGSIGEMKHRLFLIVVGGAIVVSMTGWLYALGWGALKLIRLI